VELFNKFNAQQQKNNNLLTEWNNLRHPLSQ
jgi:hypothetical protein